MARAPNLRPAELLLFGFLSANLVHLFLQAACPAAPPWPRQFEPPAAPITEFLDHSIDGTTTRRDPARPPSADSGAAPGTPPGAARRGAPRSRRRGRRGGVNWGRHGDTGVERLIIGHLNVQSLKPKLPDLRTDIHSTYGFDILALAETWLTPNIPDRLLTVSGYSLYRSDRPDELNLPKGKGGVALLVRDCLKSEQLPRPDTEAAASQLEIVWVLVHLAKNRTVLIASAYRVPNTTVRQLTADFDDLESQIQFMIAKYPRSTLVLCGDFNRCLLKTSVVDNHNIQNLLEAYGIAVTNCTRATYRPSRSLLDVIATNRPDLVKRSGVTRCHYGGPHDFTRVLLSYPPVDSATARQHHLFIRPIGRIDQAAFNLKLFSADWNDVFDSQNTDQKWCAFKHMFFLQLNLVAPLRRACVRERKAPSVTADTRDLIRSRRAALDSGERADYLRANRLCRAAIRRDCVSHYTSEIKQRGRGGLWRVLQPVIGRKQQKSAVPNVTVDALNDYYASIGRVTAASVPSSPGPIPTLLPRVMTCFFKVRPIDFDTLCITLANMKNSKSLGVDGISIDLMQKYFFGIGMPLLEVVNSSLVTATVPDSWKHALVTPIPKSKVVRSPADTRPISILPAILKLTENIVQNQLSEYLDQHKLLADSQHGYRKRFSTETALHAVTDLVLRSMDEGKISILVLLDLSKCFDVVPHAKLLEKLSLYGIDTAWFRSYLEGHTQQVQMPAAEQGTGSSRAGRGPAVASQLSKTRDVPIGFFQGGALSCLLYLLYANDLSLCVGEGVSIVQYADDTQVLVSGKKSDMSNLIARMESALAALFHWFCRNGMKVNAQKTQMIILGTPPMLRGLPPVSLRFNGTTVTESPAVRNLGITIDRSLNFQAHVDTMTRKCTGILVALSHARHVIPGQAMKVLVESLVLSIVRYCISVYGSCGSTQVRRVQKIVNFCARVVTGRRRSDHVSDAVELLGWLTAQQLADFHAICAVQHVIMNKEPLCLYRTIGPPASETHHHDTRHASNRTLPRIRTEFGRRRLCFRGISLINKSRLDPAVTGFRTTLKAAMLGDRQAISDV